MKELNFDNGLVSYSINGKCEVSFNPTDRVFVERFYNTFDDLNGIYDSYAQKGEGLTKPAESFELARQRDEEMSNVLDGLFGVPFCAEAFSDMSLCAFAKGFPLWVNLMFSVMDEILANMDDIQKQADPRIAKYKAKYQKYAAKYHK